MTKSQVLYIADTLDNAYLFQEVLSSLSVDVQSASSMQMSRLLESKSHANLMIYDFTTTDISNLTVLVEMLNTARCFALLCILRSSQLPFFELPEGIVCDFIVKGATLEECSARVRRLLALSEENVCTDVIHIDNMEINLSTYQVNIGDTPIDLTYLEYALLAFLITHPEQTYSRDALLQQVWGIDYFGGSRTVDVHVRRVRSKLGPDLSQRLETVRGVGYLWRSE